METRATEALHRPLPPSSSPDVTKMVEPKLRADNKKDASVEIEDTDGYDLACTD
jgi:hypothetical protein